MFNTLLKVFFTLLFLISCTNNNSVSKLSMSDFGNMPNGEIIKKFKISNANGISVEVINYGAIITNLFVPDSSGSIKDIVLGFNDFNSYYQNNPYFGAIVGRYGNRISNGTFLLDDVKYELKKNNGPNSLHGGLVGFDKVFWKFIEQKSDNQSLYFEYHSKHMEEGFPGNLVVGVEYSLNDSNELKIKYTASTDKKTIINLTQHSYFNLSGESSGDILDHVLNINAAYYLPVNENMIPHGPYEKVEPTPFDFNNPKKIGLDIFVDDIQLKIGNGYDHCFVLDNIDGKLKKIGSVESPVTGIKMDIITDQPGIQLYTGNFLDGSLESKEKKQYEKHSGFCLETQHFPNSPNQKEYPSVILNKGEVYNTETIYKFSY